MKRRITLIFASVIAMMLMSVGCDSNGFYQYAIGDPGPAGGTVFCIDEADNHDWTYLEVAPQSTEWTGKEWGDEGTLIDGDARSTGIGDGRAATDAVVAHMNGKGITGTAAQLCDMLSHNGFDDWFLPSKDELNAIWDNIVDDGNENNSGVAGFADEKYWSSSEAGGTGKTAYAQGFLDGTQYSTLKSFTRRVRAIRAF